MTDFTRQRKKRLLFSNGVEVLRFGVARRRGVPQLILQMRSQLSCQAENQPLALDREAVRILVRGERGLVL